MTWQTVPQCEACWINERGTWEPFCNDEGVQVGAQLTQVPIPVRLDVVELERCATCGEPTISGIYIRKDIDE